VPAGFYETRFAPFLDRYAVVLALCLVAIASLRIVSTYSVFSLTVDEPGHFACGLEYLSKHVYRYESQHPPLSRAMVALGPYLDGARLRGGTNRDAEGVDVVKHSPNPERTVTLMRLGVLPFFWLACLVVFVWAKRDFGKPVAVLAIGLFTMIPSVLAHAGLATTDMALAACVGAAFLVIVYWARTPNWKSGVLMGVATALAILSKFSAVVYLPAAAGLALGFWVWTDRPGSNRLARLARERAATFGVAAVSAAFVVWACYWFSFGTVPAWHIKLPAPEFFDGIAVVIHHNSEGHGSYLLGERSSKGWWYYFPVVLGVKTPIAFLILLLVGIGSCWKFRAKPAFLLPLAFSLGILLTGMSSNINIGVRHILPVYIGFAIVAAVALSRLMRHPVTAAFGAALVLWLAVSGAARHPDYLSYFNEFIRSAPEEVLVDSDLDWGQDLKRLSKRLHELGIRKIAIQSFGDPTRESLYDLPPREPVNRFRPTQEWTVINPAIAFTTDFTYRTGLAGTDYESLAKAAEIREPWFLTVAPTERVGTLLLIRTPPESIISIPLSLPEEPRYAMAKRTPGKSVKLRPMESKPEPAPIPAGFYETRLAPFLEKYAVLLALCLVAIASIRIWTTYSVFSVTVDEPGHFACGLEYLSKHTYQYESQHPPLGRAMSALGPYLDGTRLRGGVNRNEEGVDVIAHSPNPDRTVTLMRLGILPFFWLACFLVFVWAARDLGKPVAVLATGLFAMIPTVLAHAGLATTDMPLTACLGAAFLALIVWARTPNWKTGLLLGVASASAALSKFTALGYLPAAALLALAFYLAMHWPGFGKLAKLTQERAATFGLAVIIGAFVVWACYWFSFGTLPAGHIRLPAPEFFDGISVAMAHNTQGHGAYLLGESSTKGWWYYFPEALSVKTPIAFLILLLLGLWPCWKYRSKAGYFLPAAFSLGILLTGMSGNVNIGVRHILPVYMGFAIIAAVALSRLMQRGPMQLCAAAALVLWMAISGVARHPDYLSYFNEFVRSEPEKVLVDSDLDWGQDLKRLSKRLHELGVKKIAIESFGVPSIETLYHLPPSEPVNYMYPTQVWTVIHPTIAYTSDHTFHTTMGGTDFDSIAKAAEERRPWFLKIDPTERVGALLLFKTPEERVVSVDPK
jgi:4-amino-4-deoxy-L-arabinose transferase-like glycosyltransferase